LSADNILVIMSGPATGTAAPSGGRFAVVSKSPLTGIFASSYTGGRFGLSLKRAGYDGIMVRGKSDTPVYLKIESQEISVRDAGLLWGMDTYDLQESRKAEGDWIVIGPAGENLVGFAVIAAGKRVAGRCGLGAVMGSKNLKGIVASGNRKIIPANPDLFQKAVKTARKKIQSHEITGSKLPEQGTPIYFMRLLMRNLPAISVATTDLSDYAAVLSGIMGYNISQKDFYRLGERIFNLERLMNNREGIGRADDTLPNRILKEVREDGWSPVELDKMLLKYYKLRGWDSSGRPMPSVLEKLEI